MISFYLCLPFDDLDIFACLLHSLVVVGWALNLGPEVPLDHGYLQNNKEN